MSRENAKVYDQNISKTIPYKDMTRSQNFTGNGVTTEFTLDLDALTYNQIEVFVAGRRLRKTSLDSFQLVTALDSPEGDITVPREFEFNRSTNSITLSEQCPNIFEISLKKPKLSFVTLFLFIEIDPIFFKYQPNIGINNNSFFRINTGELKIVCK